MGSAFNKVFNRLGNRLQPVNHNRFKVDNRLCNRNKYQNFPITGKPERLDFSSGCKLCVKAFGIAIPFQV